MHKVTSLELYKLVHSLSAQQSKYYKLHAKDANFKKTKLNEIFAVMQSYKHFDNAAITRSCMAHGICQSERELRVLKNRLYSDVIEKVVHHSYRHPDTDTYIYNKLTEIQLLSNLGHYGQAERILIKTKESAVKYQRFQALQELHRLHMQILHHKEQPDIETAKSVYEQSCAQCDLIAFHHQALLCELEAQAYTAAGNFDRFAEKGELDFWLGLFGLPAFSDSVSDQITDVKVLRFLLVQAYADRQAMLAERDPNWHGKLRTIAAFISKIKKGAEYDVLLSLPKRHQALWWALVRSANNTTLAKAVKALEGYRAEDFLSEAETTHQIGMSFYLALRFAYVQAEEEKFNAVIKEQMPSFKSYEVRLKEELVMMIYTRLGELYMMHGDYKKAEISFKAMIEIGKRKHYTLRPDIALATFLLLAMVHAETGNWQKVYQTIRAARPLYKEEMPLFDQLVYEYCKAVARTTSAKEKKMATIGLVQELRRNKKDFKNQLMMKYFNFYAYFASKVGGKSFKQRIRDENGIK